ncbi:hypothetical protein SeMB42_g01674 [Synchytrium endobioticum]|uniref:Uncharacterized protein n=1 Tax=Synchytrium endobioticum TaxID=286115 RepID=A0A507CCA7_9FUNG|nr:hypothetical protein SeMB42_g06975 [Synchytrium endobioticum]TPX52038.1 hypothetical protein SeMB42_g01674 [Synchytrium endobioticum]
MSIAHTHISTYILPIVNILNNQDHFCQCLNDAYVRTTSRRADDRNGTAVEHAGPNWSVNSTGIIATIQHVTNYTMYMQRVPVTYSQTAFAV